MSHKVVGTSNFETKNLVEIFALEKDGVAELCAQIGCRDERCFLKDVIYFGIEDESEIVGGIVWEKVVVTETREDRCLGSVGGDGNWGIGGVLECGKGRGHDRGMTRETRIGTCPYLPQDT